MAAERPTGEFGRLENLYSLSKFIAFKRSDVVADNVLTRRPITEDDPLPDGWEVRFTDLGMPFFLSHELRETTYQDPRPLPRFIGMRVTGARGLRKMDTFKRGDPYCLVRLRRGGSRVLDPMSLLKKDRRNVFLKTETNKNTSNPAWDESFFFSIASPSDFIEVYVYDWERGRKDQLIGYVAIPAVEVFVHTVALDAHFPIWTVARALEDPPEGGGSFKKDGQVAEGELLLEFSMVGSKFEEGGASGVSREDQAAQRLAAARAEARRVKTRCASCLDNIADVVHFPCGHALMCRECTDVFRAEHGEVCNVCREPSQVTDIVTEETCVICYGEFDSTEIFCLGDCGHLVCVHCTIEVVRGALGNVHEQFPLRCPCFVSGTERCPTVVNIDRISNLVRVSARVLPHGEALSREEYDRFDKYNNIAAIPAENRTYCINVDCGGLLIVDHGCDTPPDTVIECLYCHHTWCYGCSVNHDGMTCAEYEAAQRGADDATRDYISATSKLCPTTGCGMRWVHYRGHRCHHLNPGRGCPGCGTEFCYACLGVWPNHQGNCSTYCNANCDCPPCPDCRPGTPCDLCSNDHRCPSCNPP